MTRRGKGYQGTRRTFSDQQAEKRFDENLNRLSDLCFDYDAGRVSYALPIAVEIHKLLTEGGSYSTRRRGTVMYPGPADRDSSTNLAAFYLLTMAQVRTENSRPTGGFLHQFVQLRDPVKQQKFKKWWNEVVYRASAAPPGTPPGMIPVNGSPTVPFDKRERLSRRELIAMLRNHAGAHDSNDYPVVLDEIDGPESWGGFEMQNSATGELVSTDDGSLEWTAGQLAASARQIAEEVLIAFGRRQLPKP